MKRYTIREASELSGLPASTLRYYETIGLIAPVSRATSGHRTYSQDDLDLIDGIACLSATGMPISEMREYIANLPRGAAGAAQEIALLHQQSEVLEQEAQRIRLRQAYVRLKIDYWKAVERGDDERAARIAADARQAALDMRFAADRDRLIHA